MPSSRFLCQSFSSIVLLIFLSFTAYSLYSLTLTFDEAMSGVACDLNSRGFHVLCKATEEAVGHVQPYSITGSLPLIRELQVRYIHKRSSSSRPSIKPSFANCFCSFCQGEGFDVQTAGYGMRTYCVFHNLIVYFRFKLLKSTVDSESLYGMLKVINQLANPILYARDQISPFTIKVNKILNISRDKGEGGRHWPWPSEKC